MSRFAALPIVVSICAFVAICVLSRTAWSFEDVNMGTVLGVENGHLVVRWSTKGFHHYNVRWSENGGRATQVERDGDKDFRYLSAFHAGVVYEVAVQGCEKSMFSHSRCTSWDSATCGTARNPCTGDVPRPIVNKGGLCLDVNAAEQRVNGGRVQLWACNGSDQQLWWIGGGHVTSLAGKCLDAQLPDLHNNGGRVQVWDCNGSVQQRWMLQGFQLRSGGGKCLDAHAPALRQNGDKVQIWDCNGAIQQQWSQPGIF